MPDAPEPPPRPTPPLGSPVPEPREPDPWSLDDTARAAVRRARTSGDDTDTTAATLLYAAKLAHIRASFGEDDPGLVELRAALDKYIGDRPAEWTVPPLSGARGGPWRAEAARALMTECAAVVAEVRAFIHEDDPRLLAVVAHYARFLVQRAGDLHLCSLGAEYDLGEIEALERTLMVAAVGPKDADVLAANVLRAAGVSDQVARAIMRAGARQPRKR